MERAVEVLAELAEVVVGFFMIDFLTEADLGIEPRIGKTFLMCTLYIFLTQRYGGPRGCSIQKMKSDRFNGGGKVKEWEWQPTFFLFDSSDMESHWDRLNRNMNLVPNC